MGLYDVVGVLAWVAGIGLVGWAVYQNFGPGGSAPAPPPSRARAGDPGPALNYVVQRRPVDVGAPAPGSEQLAHRWGEILLYPSEQDARREFTWLAGELGSGRHPEYPAWELAVVALDARNPWAVLLLEPRRSADAPVRALHGRAVARAADSEGVHPRKLNALFTGQDAEVLDVRRG